MEVEDRIDSDQHPLTVWIEEESRMGRKKIEIKKNKRKGGM